MNIKRLNFNRKKENKSQSLVELAVIFMILLMLLVGMVEGGTLLNQYINLVDGAREGARFGSNDDPFYIDPKTSEKHYRYFFAQIYTIVQGTFDASGVQTSKGAINPLVLDPKMDDIVVSFYIVTTNASSNTVSLEQKMDTGKATRYNNYQPLKLSFIQDRIKSDTPNTGLVVVEIYYHYHQILRFFDFANDNEFNDPDKKYTILVHSYSIMPLSSAEPTPTP